MIGIILILLILLYIIYLSRIKDFRIKRRTERFAADLSDCKSIVGGTASAITFKISKCETALEKAVNDIEYKTGATYIKPIVNTVAITEIENIIPIDEITSFLDFIANFASNIFNGFCEWVGDSKWGFIIEGCPPEI